MPGRHQARPPAARLNIARRTERTDEEAEGRHGPEQRNDDDNRRHRAVVHPLYEALARRQLLRWGSGHRRGLRQRIGRDGQVADRRHRIDRVDTTAHRTPSARKRLMLKYKTGMTASSRITASALARPESLKVNNC